MASDKVTSTWNAGHAPLPYDMLRTKLPGITFSPSSSEYQARLSKYYSIQQQALKPLYVVKPTTPEQVSQVIKLAAAESYEFAVASGGHMCWSGSSNIHNGFILDMSGFRQVDVSAKEQTVKLGPGASWKDVYTAMAPLNVTVAGGRINDVGVGGLLLGGGISFSSAAKGFGANSVYNYEVVLSDGRIVNANKNSHNDLFWALKLAGSNFGIVTRFDMHTYPSAAIWGTVNGYTATETVVSNLLTEFERYGHDNDHREEFQAAMFVRTGRADLAMSVHFNTDGVSQQPLTRAPPVHHLEGVGSTKDVVNDVAAAALESEARAHWCTLTTKIDRKFLWDVFLKGKEIFGPLDSRRGLSWVVSNQAFKKSLIEATAGSPVYNALKRSGDDLVCMLFLTTWTDAADDDDMKAATNQHAEWTTKEARRRGILDEFVYLNYANGQQRVYEGSLTPEDLQRMQKIREAYDPSRVFETLWKGGFKLPAEKQA